jgi:hypothetical protein
MAVKKQARPTWFNPFSMRAALRLREFEPQGPADWALIPWWIARYFFAWCWTQAWYPAWRLNNYTIHGRLGRRLSRLPSMGGRHSDPDPVMCPRCLWAGPARWLVHGYASYGYEDVEPQDECPRCGYWM